MKQTKPLIIPESKEKLDNIRKKYNNMNMSDDIANKVNHLEITGQVLKTAAILVGVVTVVDFFVPDALPVVDEVVLTTATTVLATISKTVDKKVDDLVNTGETKITANDVISIGSQLGKLAKNKKKENKNVKER